MKICKAKNCNSKHSSKDCCAKHYEQIKRYGKILKRTERDKNEYVECDDCCEMILYKRGYKQEEKTRTLIDKEDYSKVKDYKWGLCGNGYVRNSKNKIYLHQLILGRKKGFDIDHIDHNVLDNRKENLRHCTRSQNLMNRNSRGCSWNKHTKKWQAQIGINKKNIYLGSFNKKEEAKKVRREAELKYFKEFNYTLQ